MQIILSDHNCEGQADAIFNILRYDGDWLQLVPMELRWFRDVGLAIEADDELVWQTCQEYGYLLLTGNRSTKDGNESLEYKIRHLRTLDSLPVITIGNLKRVGSDLTYRRRCAVQLAEIVSDIDNLRGIMRLFIP